MRLGRWDTFVFQVSYSHLRTLIKRKVCFCTEPVDACLAVVLGPIQMELHGSHVKLFGSTHLYSVFLWLD